MLSYQEMTCVDCYEADMTFVEMKVAKNGRVIFNVICERCGGFSHRLLDYTEINRAVKIWLDNHAASAQGK